LRHLITSLPDNSTQLKPTETQAGSPAQLKTNLDPQTQPLQQVSFEFAYQAQA
jgi:hypothetical protein